MKEVNVLEKLNELKNRKPLDDLEELYDVFDDTFNEEIDKDSIRLFNQITDEFIDELSMSDLTKEQIYLCIKKYILNLNSFTQETGLIETMEREMIYEFIEEVLGLFDLHYDDFDFDEFREW